jgi:hypothetical protein
MKKSGLTYPLSTGKSSVKTLKDEGFTERLNAGPE